MIYTIINKPINTNVKSKYFSLKPGSFIVNIDLDKNLFVQLEKDTLLIEELHEIANEYYKKYVLDVVNNTLSKADAICDIAKEKGAPESFFKKQTEGLNKMLADNVNVAAKACEQAVTKKFNGFIKTREKYKKYKIKVGFKITMSIASLLASVGSLAASGFTMGAGTIVALAGIFKTSANLGQQIAIAYEKAATTLNVIKKRVEELKPQLQESLDKRKMTEALLLHPSVVKALEKTGPEETAKALYSKQIVQYCFSSEKKLAAALKSGEITKGGLSKSNAGKEVLATLGSWATGISLPSIQSLGDDWDTLQDKTKGVEVKSHDLSRQLNDILDKQGDLDADFNEAIKQYQVTGTKKEAIYRGNYQKHINALMAKTQKLWKNTNETYSEFKRIDTKIQNMTSSVEAILALRGNWFDRLDKALDAADFLLAFASIEKDTFSSAAKFMDSVRDDLLQTGAEYTLGKILDKVTT